MGDPGSAVITAADRGERADALGGKATRLAELERLGYPVPPWFAVSSRVYTSLLARPATRRQLDELIAGLERGEARDGGGERVAAMLVDAELDAAVWAEISEAYRRLFPGDAPVAVRSSANVEDASDRSYAGQLDSFLDVRGEEEVRRAIGRCWASAFSSRALAYGRLHRIRPDGLEVAVVVQQMVPARVAGVMFTADPASGRKDVVVVSAVRGLALPLVSGATEGDSYRVGKETLAVEMDGGSVLAPDEARALARLGIRLESDLGGPQDIEWALDGDNVSVLQARPVTGALRSETRTVWDNANIVESYPGITLPLTYSVAREAYATVYRQAGVLAGLSDATLEANDDAYESMIGLVRGRVYYNLTSWYRLLSLLPGFRHNKAFMEQMMGVRESLAWTSETGRICEAVGIARLAVRTAWLAATIERQVAAFERLVEEACREHEHAGTQDLDLRQLVERFEELKGRLFRNWRAPIVNDFLTMVFHGVLRRLTRRYGLEADGTLANDLLRGDGLIRSVEPARAVMRLAATARADVELATVLARNSDRDLRRLLVDGAAYPEFTAELERYLAAHGSRCTEELKLEIPSMRDDPAPLFAAIRGYLERGDFAWPEERPARERAEDEVRRRLGSHVPRALVFGRVLARTRRHLRHRENMRLARGRVFGVARDLFTAIGARLHDADRVDDPRDVFYLTVEEIRACAGGSEQDLRELIASRKQEFEAYRSEPPPPDRFEAVGEALIPAVGAPREERGSLLQGHGCCPGVVRGRPRVLDAPHGERLAAGEILVARHTDPGWVTVFPLAAGILVERGSALSHSAIVARELGIPTIVGIPGLTQAVDGATDVEMDGATGMVRVVGAGA